MVNNTPLQTHIRDGSQDDDSTAMTVQPMRPLLRGYCSNLTLPVRGSPGTQVRYPSRLGAVDLPTTNGQPDYCEVSVASGYLSDGEMLRNGHKPHVDNYDGYMSEGGSLYGKKMQGLASQLPNGWVEFPD